ncbi:MAG: DUF3592 domain-containing protein [Myxococcota bacterium]
MDNFQFYIGPVIGVVFALVSVGFAVRIFSNLANASKEAARVLSIGQPAVGQVLSAMQTGTYVNNNPQIRLTICVTPHGGTPYQVNTTKVVSMFEIPQYQVGAQLDVRVDPANPSKVAIAGPLQPIAAQPVAHR